MKLSREFLQQVRIPTKGMERFEIIRNLKSVINTGVFDELRYVSFYRDLGQLEDYAALFVGEPLVYAYYVQREDGVVVVDTCDSRGNIEFDFIKRHLDSHVKATVIACRVPACNVPRYGLYYLNSECGALEFLAHHHPSPTARVAAIAKLMEMYPEEVWRSWLTIARGCEHRLKS